jgi:ureidoglycolate lyase/2,4-diketo-3-deoxy-L-fuconate hydrolase
MKLLRYGTAGREKPGLLDSNNQIRDLSGIVPDIAREAILPDALDRLRMLDPATLPVVKGAQRIGPCVGQVGKFICVGLNYSDHAAESGMAVPAEPILFMKATSSIVGPDDDILLPRGSQKTDWEVELGVVIGKPGKYVSEADSLAHVAGYCVVHDISERAYQLEGTGQWVKGKSADTFGPIGPWLVTTDEVPDPGNLRLWLDLNGTRRQDGSTKTLIFGVQYLVSYISRFMSLQSGDVIPPARHRASATGRSRPCICAPATKCPSEWKSGRAAPARRNLTADGRR